MEFCGSTTVVIPKRAAIARPATTRAYCASSE